MLQGIVESEHSGCLLSSASISPHPSASRDDEDIQETTPVLLLLNTRYSGPNLTVPSNVSSCSAAIEMAEKNITALSREILFLAYDPLVKPPKFVGGLCAFCKRHDDILLSLRIDLLEAIISDLSSQIL